MTLKFSAVLKIDAKEQNKAIFNSIRIDNKFYPENPTKTYISFNKKIEIKMESTQIPHLRANLNSILRLVQASYDCIESVKI